MTWIATCNGERGIHQETVMTDAERKKLCKDLRESEGWYHSDGILMEQAADEIERLAAIAQSQELVFKRIEQLEAQVAALSRM